MSTISGRLALGRKWLQNPSLKNLANNGSQKFHTGLPAVQAAQKNKDGKIPVTMIPGDGVGPELMDSVQGVFKSLGSPVEFRIKHLSEVRFIQKISFTFIL